MWRGDAPRWPPQRSSGWSRTGGRAGTRGLRRTPRTTASPSARTEQPACAFGGNAQRRSIQRVHNKLLDYGLCRHDGSASLVILGKAVDCAFYIWGPVHDGPRANPANSLLVPARAARAQSRFDTAGVSLRPSTPLHIPLHASSVASVCSLPTLDWSTCLATAWSD